MLLRLVQCLLFQTIPQEEYKKLVSHWLAPGTNLPENCKRNQNICAGNYVQGGTSGQSPTFVDIKQNIVHLKVVGKKQTQG